MSFSPDFIYLIGVGGTGGHLSAPLARLIAYHQSTKDSTVVFIDGDEFEEKNMTRQIVGETQVGLNKARAMVDFCRYQGLTNVDYEDSFISLASFIPMLNRSRSPMVVCAVDNDATRHAVIQALKLSPQDKDFFFITPGNSDGTEDVKGQTLWFGRVDGQNVGLDPSMVYPNIENPSDSIPRKGSCARNAPSLPQLIPANFMAAATTLAVIQNVLDDVMDAGQSGMFFNLRTLTTSIS